MGVYAQTNFVIYCKNAQSAKKVLEALKAMGEDDNGNTFGTELKVSGKIVYGFEDSGRIQNLEYRCRAIWDIIKDIKGVLEMNAPFLSEADGMYFEVGVN